ncbi:hypothetical protein [Streptomyces sp. NBC_00872]|uniref:hypothetical protein n=1 Tax=Streptomyces sp. NBC_00872 TaxID=2903686 RepID=UPI00386EF578|nr:lipocalin-like domain-containing protein [Streptomyces sp. NBC_00872]
MKSRTIAADPSWSGTEQVRDITLSGDGLVLGRTWAVDGRTMRARLEWHRR